MNIERFVTPTEEPDEGYSEAPLATTENSRASGNLALAASLRTPAELTAFLTTHAASLSVSDKTQLAKTILDDLPTSVIAEIVQKWLHPRLYIDFVNYLPVEICLKILGYLDPVSLVHVAFACRSWYTLSLDRKLWEKLYYMEGWRAVPAAIRSWEQRVNESSPTQVQRLKSHEDGHTHKKRAISDVLNSTDHDYDMMDVDRPSMPEQRDTQMSGMSLFGGPQFKGSGSSSKSTASVSQYMGNLMMQSPSPMHDYKGKSVSRSSSDAKGKGKAVADFSNETPARQRLPPFGLWAFDDQDSRYKMNWKYLYTLRRRLETNWEQGNYTNFQLPHPDHPEEGHSDSIYSLQYNSDYLVSGSRDHTLRIWNLQTRRLVRPPLKAHTGSVLCVQFDSDPDEDLIVSGSSDSDVILWRFSTGQMIQRLNKAHSESVLNVKFDKRILVTCSKDKSIKIFTRIKLRPGDLGYSPVEGLGPVPQRVDFGAHSPMADNHFLPPLTMIGCLEGHGAAVNAVQISGEEIVSASGDRNIKVWDWPNQLCRRTICGHQKGIACVQYDGRRIVSGSSDWEVKVFDGETGAEVASLKGHSALVRTVQAGFADLPYSIEEDRDQARAVDQEFFKAVESGRVVGAPSTRTRLRNAGSRRPEDIMATGAHLPPGGGGGRYSRIVSGSYDQSIIVWRRDHKGVWKKAHTLRQEEAAASALRQERGTSRPQTRPSLPFDPTIRPAPTQTRSAPPPSTGPTSAPPSISQTSQQGQQLGHAQLEHPIIATITPQTTASYTQMIDMLVPQGPTALTQALANYPTMLTYEAHLAAAIDREPMPMVRAQLRQIVGAALTRTQVGQARAREVALQQAVASNSTSDDSQAAPSSGPSTGNPWPSEAFGNSANGPPTGRSVQAQPSMPPGAPRAQIAQTTQPVPATPRPAPQQQHHTHNHHPHIPPADPIPAKVFKLQFDASRIICCSQTNTIVGWDFCNGDPELEEVAKVFGSVE